MVNKVLILCGIEGLFFFAVPSLLSYVFRAHWRECKPQFIRLPWVTNDMIKYG